MSFQLSLWLPLPPGLWRPRGTTAGFCNTAGVSRTRPFKPWEMELPVFGEECDQSCSPSDFDGAFLKVQGDTLDFCKLFGCDSGSRNLQASWCSRGTLGVCCVSSPEQCPRKNRKAIWRGAGDMVAEGKLWWGHLRAGLVQERGSIGQ